MMTREQWILVITILGLIAGIVGIVFTMMVLRRQHLLRKHLAANHDSIDDKVRLIEAHTYGTRKEISDYKHDEFARRLAQEISEYKQAQQKEPPSDPDPNP